MPFNNWIQVLVLLAIVLGGCSSPTPPQCVVLSVNAGDSESFPFQQALSAMPETEKIWSRSLPGHTDICLCGKAGISRDSIKNLSLKAFSKAGPALPPNTLFNLDPRKNPFLRKLFDLDLREIREKVPSAVLFDLGHQLAAVPGLKINGVPTNLRTFTIIPKIIPLQEQGITLSDLWIQLRLASKQKPLVDPQDLGSWAILSQVDSGQFVPLGNLALLKMEATPFPDFFNMYLQDTVAPAKAEEVKKQVEDILVKFLVVNNLTESPGTKALRPWNDRRPVRYEFSGADPEAVCHFLQDMFQDLSRKAEEDEILDIFPCGDVHFKVDLDKNRMAAFGIQPDQVSERMNFLQAKTILPGTASEPILNWNPLNQSVGMDNLLNLAVGTTSTSEQICIKDLAQVTTTVEIRRESMQVSYPIYVWGPQGTAILNMIETYPLPEGITRKAGDTQFQFPDFRNPEDFR